MNTSKNTSNFYSELPAVQSFLEFDNSDYYKTVPNDWWIIITDIQGSTDAVAKGKFREVNIAGAASIVALTKSKYGLLIPFVFGGDGATALMPADAIEDSIKRLRSTQAVIKKNYDLNMRIGLIKVNDIATKGFDFSVARYQLPAGPSLAFFKGSGFDEAERLIKAGVGNLVSSPADIDSMTLEGLSCRWSPLQNERGKILTILVKEHTDCKKTKILEEIAKKIDIIVDLNAALTHPVKSKIYNNVSIFKAIRVESALQNKPFFSSLSLKIVLQMLFTYFAKYTGFKTESTDIKSYYLGVNQHSDHKKFDSTLRMVIDCTHAMAEEIKAYLNDKHQQKEIFYGLHESEEAFLTCYLESTAQGRHIHFVDGGGGGYTAAAKQLKKQLLENSEMKQLISS